MVDDGPIEEPSTADAEPDLIGPVAMPEPIRWRPVLLPSAILMGILVDVGFEVVMQQLGLALLTVNSIVYNIVEGTVLGIVAPSLGALIGAVYVNRKIRKLEAP